MNIQILSTKLYIPQVRSKVVHRPRLFERLNEGLDRKLTLISVSAGFGKTTLVSEWVSHCGRPVAWLSIDDGDSDCIRFFSHLIAAMQSIGEDLGGIVTSELDSQQTLSPTTIESMLTTLLNEISILPYKSVLVLDDYHSVGVNWIDDAIIFLLEHLPAQLHLVIATREDPQLPLSRLRARGQLSELREVDLRFTPDEAAIFLNQTMGLNLSADEIMMLDSRTEGWITGLQLAALSMNRRKDTSAFIRAFAGDNRYIVDYLIEEVLQRQPEHVRRFLLQTSVLDRLHGPLCDAVTGQENGSARLEALNKGNFFVIPLDDRRQWYRYHHLFTEVLYAHLKTDHPNQIVILHQRASLWYEQHDLVAESIHHALASEDFVRVADLVELAMLSLRKNRRESLVLSWLKALPDVLIQCRPVLSVGYAGMLLSSGELDGVERRLQDAERWLDSVSDRREPYPVGMVVVDVEEFRRLPASIAMYRAGIALVRGDVQSTMTYARRVLDHVTEEDHLTRGAATALLGLASWRNGDLETAHRMFAGGIESVQMAGAISDAINGSIALAEIRIAQGQLRQAMSTYERGLQLATGHGELKMRGTADMYVGMSEIYLEYNDLDTAKTHLLRSEELGELAGFPQNRFRHRIAMARIEEAQGNFDGALELLNDADHLYMSDFFPNVRPIAALKSRMMALQGRREEALEWARGQGLSTKDDLQYLHEFEHITLARIYLASHSSDDEDSSILETMGLLERLLQAAEEGGRTGGVIEILVLQAMAYYMEGNIPLALVPLERALKLAKPEGYIRIFLSEGHSMKVLLEATVNQDISLNYARQLLEAYRINESRIPVNSDTESKPMSELLNKSMYEPQDKSLNAQGKSLDESLNRSLSNSLSEPLSARERDVLRLLSTDLSGPDISRELMVSLNTLRTHTKNIYDKLEVNTRRSAVRRAEQLKLL